MDPFRHPNGLPASGKLLNLGSYNLGQDWPRQLFPFNADGRAAGPPRCWAGLSAGTTTVTVPSRSPSRRGRLNIGSLRFCLNGTQGLDERPCSRRQGPAAKVEHAMSRSHLRYAAVQLDEAPRRHVLGKQRGGAREKGIAVKRDQPGVCERIDQDLRDEIGDAWAVRSRRGSDAGDELRLGTTERS